MSAATSSPDLPLFYHRVVSLDPTLHADLRLERWQDFSFAAQTGFVPLGLGEIESAAQHFPVLFTTGADPVPAALLGLRAGQNLFVMPDGKWRDNSYVPAYCRAFPFILAHNAAAETTFVGMEADAPCLRGDAGEKLFADGVPTPTLQQAIALCDAFRAHALAAAAFGRALAGAGLLEEDQATVNLKDGESLQARGYQVVRSERLAELPDETLLDWRRRGWLSTLYGHLFSQGRWSRLIELAGAPAQPVDAPKAKPKRSRRRKA